MSGSRYPVVWVGGGRTHAVFPTEGYSERELAEFETFCGLRVRDFDLWGQSGVDEPVECKRCRRSLSARAQANPAARNTLAMGWSER